MQIQRRGGSFCLLARGLVICSYALHFCYGIHWSIDSLFHSGSRRGGSFPWHHCTSQRGYAVRLIPIFFNRALVSRVLGNWGILCSRLLLKTLLAVESSHFALGLLEQVLLLPWISKLFRHFWRLSSPIPLLQKESLRVGGHLSFVYLQAWRLHSLSGQLLPGCDHPYSKNSFMFE